MIDKRNGYNVSYSKSIPFKTARRASTHDPLRVGYPTVVRANHFVKTGVLDTSQI